MLRKRRGLTWKPRISDIAGWGHRPQSEQPDAGVDPDFQTATGPFSLKPKPCLFAYVCGGIWECARTLPRWDLPKSGIISGAKELHPVLTQLVEDVELTGSVCIDVRTLLTHYGRPRTVEHCLRVASEAKQLAARFGARETLAEMAGWLHDISAVYPTRECSRVARQLGVDVLPEEDACPMIVHQKLSATLAQEVFGVTNQEVLSAIGCHTTLKADASLLDKVVFIADKVRWDGCGEAPFAHHVLAGLEESPDRAVWAYLDYLWQRRDTLPVVHPWMVAAYGQLSVRV